MSERINTIDLENVGLLDRTIENIGKVNSIRLHPITGKSLVCYPIVSDDNNNPTGNVILYPQNPTNTSYSSTTIKTIVDYGDLNFPLDACWNPFNRRYWIADAGNNSIVCLSSIDNSFIRSVDGFILPHSIILNKNNRIKVIIHCEIFWNLVEFSISIFNFNRRYISRKFELKKSR